MTKKPGPVPTFGRTLSAVERVKLSRKRHEFLEDEMREHGLLRHVAYLPADQVSVLGLIAKKYTFEGVQWDNPARLGQFMWVIFHNYIKETAAKIPGDTKDPLDLEILKRARELPEFTQHEYAERMATANTIEWALKEFAPAAEATKGAAHETKT